MCEKLEGGECVRLFLLPRTRPSAPHLPVLFPFFFFVVNVKKRKKERKKQHSAMPGGVCFGRRYVSCSSVATAFSVGGVGL